MWDGGREDADGSGRVVRVLVSGEVGCMRMEEKWVGRDMVRGGEFDRAADYNEPRANNSMVSNSNEDGIQLPLYSRLLSCFCPSCIALRL